MTHSHKTLEDHLALVVPLILIIGSITFAVFAVRTAESQKPQRVTSWPAGQEYLDASEDYWARIMQEKSTCDEIELLRADLSHIDAAGQAEIGGCRIWIDYEYAAEPHLACYIMAHEYGHVLGYDHSNDPSNPLYVGGNYHLDIPERDEYSLDNQLTEEPHAP